MMDSHTASHEKTAWTTSGYLMLGILIVLLVLTAARVLGFAASNPTDDDIPGFLASLFLGPVGIVLIAKGFYICLLYTSPSPRD